MSQKAKKMAELFDVDLDESMSKVTDEADNLEEVVSTKPLHRTFKEECKDLQDVLEKSPSKRKTTIKTEPAPVDVAVQPKTSVPVETKPPAPAPVTTDEDDGDGAEFGYTADMLDEVDRDIEKFSQTKEEIMASIAPNAVKKETVEASQIPQETTSSKTDNPLGLSGGNLAIYNKINKDFPQFKLSDGSVGFKEFYICKLDYLNRILGRFKLLDFASMCKEIRQVKTDHFIGDDFLNPDVIAKKMDNAYRWRVRLNSILADVYEQYYLWERFVEILRSKLFKDHELRGAHKRDALVFDHLSDMEQYVAEMTGFMEMTKNYDGILKAATDSLSRQVTCLQLNEEFGLNRKKTNTTNNNNQNHVHNHNRNQYKAENLDTIDIGTQINIDDANNGIAASRIVYENEDEISRLGN